MSITLPRPEFALCKMGKWSLYRLTDGRFVAHRKQFETLRDGKPFLHEEKFIDWPSQCDDIPARTRLEFGHVAREMTVGLT